MKKYAPALVVIGVLVIAGAAYALTRDTAQAPEVLPESPATTTETSTETAAEPSVPVVPVPADTTPVAKVYANPAWGFKLSYNSAWSLTQTGDVVNVGMPTAGIVISPEQEVAEPAQLDPVETTRTILGQEVKVSRYENPRETYEYYEFFKLRVNKVEYYFKIISTIDPNPQVEKFLADISAQ